MTSSYKEHEHQYSLSPTLCYQTPNHLKGHRHHWHHKNLINQAPIIQRENKVVTKHEDHKLIHNNPPMGKEASNNQPKS